MKTACSIVLAMVSVAPFDSADVLYDEGVSGDISGDRFNPTQGGVLAIGSNTLSASVVLDDRDFITFNVPAGSELTSVTLNAF
ncbi:MAG: hypothetical protein KDB18_09035, partial [Salinibacterium sp.]|nr:hypothetical protein [Salinibacterium sp.]